MRTIETKVYKFDELSNDAKAKAVEKMWDVNVDYEWWDSVYEDAADIAELFGLDIRQTKQNTINIIKFTPTIYFSGFSSQGDGACFEGYYSYKKGALKAVKQHTPEDKTLHEIVATLQSLQKDNFYRVTCTMTHRGHYNHSGCMTVDCENSHDSYLDVKGEDDFVTCMRDFADWIYKRLEEQHDYLTAEETVIETIEANEYEFTEDGEMI